MPAVMADRSPPLQTRPVEHLRSIGTTEMLATSPFSQAARQTSAGQPPPHIAFQQTGTRLAKARAHALPRDPSIAGKQDPTESPKRAIVGCCSPTLSQHAGWHAQRWPFARAGLAMTSDIRALPRRYRNGLRTVDPGASGEGLTSVGADTPVEPPFEVPWNLRLNVVVNGLRLGKQVADRAFDAIYPSAVRGRSAQYSTPVEIARRAARMLVVDAATCVLDVGSGAGKFCLVGALTTEGHFVGVEHRGRLVGLARSIADRYGAMRATYVHGDMRSVDWREFNGFYFYNPFAENNFGSERFDDSIELTPERYERDLRFAVDALGQQTLVGTRVVTYHGLGRELPRSFERLAMERVGDDVLELWVRVKR